MITLQFDEGVSVEQAQLEVEYNDWQSVHDHMSKTLRVYGECEIRGGGFAVGLETRKEQGINPKMLLLNLRFTPTGESPSHQPVEFKQPWNDEGIQYEEVGFVVVGEIPAPAPPARKIEDIY